MFEVLNHFQKKFQTLTKEGLRFQGLSLIDPKRKKHVIMISKPFVFDNRKLPKVYDGLEVKAKIEGELPLEFIVDARQEYRWAPQRFEHFVDRCGDEIRKKLKNPKMTRQEMLDALAFGNFEAHKKKCSELLKEGKIPPLSLN
ncbi:MAG: hypothetical protein JST67_03345 [Bacteroidetes bacterium]|nr:hypothetical protein [Bacteroidota bacterium]